MKNNTKTLMAFLCLMMLLSSCTTIKQPSEVYSQPDYTAQDVRNQEVKRIEALREKNGTEALWRSLLLGDTDVVASCFSDVVSAYRTAVEKKEWFEALRLYRSLSASAYPDIKTLPENEDRLTQLCLSGVPGLVNKSSPAAASGAQVKTRVSSYISGTVTVWVDRGVKIEKGVGYADRVIGSGFFISKDGYIVTNNHVIEDVVDPKNEGYSRLYVKLASDSETRIPAKVIGWDPVVDLALLKAEIEAPYVFPLGSSQDLDAGDRIYAIGSPVGLERTLTSGIVSATDRKLFTIGSVMQIDAAVNSGNSGGPCIDENGAVQAIVFAGMLQYEGLNFAIPVEYLVADLPGLFHGGKYEHPWMGAYGHTKKEMGKDAGLEVQYVLPGAGASRARIAAGDTIVAVDGKTVHTLEDMQRILLYRTPDSIVTVSCQTSSGAEKQVLVYLSDRPENPGYTVYQNDVLAGSFTPIYGMKLTSLSNGGSKKYAISSIIRGSVADESGFSENDPVEVQNIKFNDDNSVIYSELYTKNRKKGYLDAVMALTAPLDSPYYF
jgi:S1-C subfamily serine protease